MPRDDFLEPVKRTVAARVAYLCSRPTCRATTTGPKLDDTESLNVGVAAHITAAAAGGPRYDPSLTAEQRREISNAIWLCQTCAKLVDNDEKRFPEPLLREWKHEAEDLALVWIGKAQGLISIGRATPLSQTLSPIPPQQEDDHVRAPATAIDKPTGPIEPEALGQSELQWASAREAVQPTTESSDSKRKLYARELADRLLAEAQKLIDAGETEKAYETAQRLEESLLEIEEVFSAALFREHFFTLSRIFTSKAILSKRTGILDVQSIEKARLYLTKARAQAHERH